MNPINYIKEVNGELKHVSWPTRKQTIYFTIIVIIVSFLTAYYLGLFDYIFTKLLDTFIV